MTADREGMPASDGQAPSQKLDYLAATIDDEALRAAVSREALSPASLEALKSGKPLVLLLLFSTGSSGIPKPICINCLPALLELRSPVRRRDAYPDYLPILHRIGHEHQLLSRPTEQLAG